MRTKSDIHICAYHCDMKVRDLLEALAEANPDADVEIQIDDEFEPGHWDIVLPATDAVLACKSHMP